MPTEVHLIGEYHLDFLKTKRYAAAVEMIKPDTLSVETDEESVEKNQLDANRAINELGSEKMLLQHLGKERYSSLLDVLTGMAAIIPLAKKNNLPVHYVDDSGRKLQEEILTHLQSVNSADSDTIAENKSLWKEIFSAPSLKDMVFLRAFGLSQIRLYAADGIPPEQVYLTGPIGVLLSSNEEKLLQAQKLFDTFYYSEFPRDPSVFDMEPRDAQIAEKISNLEGKVIHCGGNEHIFGKHKNLFDRLQEKDINVKRYKLIDFDCRGETYLQEVQLLAKDYTRLSEEIKQGKRVSPFLL